MPRALTQVNTVCLLSSFLSENRFKLWLRKLVCSFQRKMLSNLTCILIYSLTKFVLVYLKICRNISKRVFTVKDVTVFRFTTFLNEVLRQIQFLRNIRNIQYKTVQIWTVKCDFNKEWKVSIIQTLFLVCMKLW